MNEKWAPAPDRKEMQQAFATKDASYDGVFYVAVKTTGIFCRPSCPSKPNLANIEFFPSVSACIAAGYRPCLRCRPQEANGTQPGWVRRLMELVEATPDARFAAADLKKLGVSPERARRWFQQNYGMTFSAWCRGRRLSGALMELRSGASLDDATFNSGFESHSGFRDAFTRAFGQTPGQSRRKGEAILVSMIDSPLGPLVAGATDQGLALLEFTERRMLETNIERMQRRFGCAAVPGRHKVLDLVRAELSDYFEGKRREFTIPLVTRGTAFQEKVWAELRRIPFAQKISYDELARRIGQPTASRAVARANGMNSICILIPCHRVIGKDGTLTGYGGGLWRKRLLLELEGTGKFPGDDAGALGPVTGQLTLRTINSSRE